MESTAHVGLWHMLIPATAVHPQPGLEERLKLAASRAEVLGVSIEFVRSDAAALGFADDSTFDLVCSTNGFFVWIADLGAVFREVSRILKPGGAYVFYDIHPFMRPWKDQVMPIEMEKPYWETGPFQGSADGSFGFNWTLADLLNPLAQAGLTLKKVLESPAQDSRFWQGSNDAPGTDESLLDWKANPSSWIAGLANGRCISNMSKTKFGARTVQTLDSMRTRQIVRTS